jgi:CRISP-associated protein Cas1
MPPLEPLLTARQLNEFVYCPRLFYYETVEGLFTHNADTVEGQSAHKRVNASESGLPAASASNPTGDPTEEIIHARSVSLFSESMGLTAKLDLVEVGSTTLRPVEYKKGAPQEGENGITLWPSDKIQLGLQILLLRENGFTCDEGVLYYRATRQRVPFVLDASTEGWIREQVQEARKTTQGPIPAPLDHSRKCPRCSLVGICLPDETQSLCEGEALDRRFAHQLDFDLPAEPLAPPADRINWGPFAELPEIRIVPPKAGSDVRRLIAPNPETKALYLNTPGHYVGKKGGEVTVSEEGKVIQSFRLHELHHVALFGPVQLSTAVVQTLCEKDIPITYFSMGGWFYGMTRGHSLKNVFTRIEQFRHAADRDLALLPARLFAYGKIRNQRTMLMRNHIQPPEAAIRLLKHLAAASLCATSTGELLGIEGNAAWVYFTEFAGMLKCNPDAGPNGTSWPFFSGERNRRPPRDPVNALLSLTYSLLAKDCTLACYAAGFDPYIGFLHQPRFGRPALALDLMEEFRPIIADSVVITLLNNDMLKPSDFLHAGESVSLSPAGRKSVFLTYEKRMNDLLTHPVFGYKVCYRRAIELQARMLGKYLTEEIEQYVPLTTR